MKKIKRRMSKRVDLKDVADTEHSSDSGSIGMGMPQMDLLSPTYAFSEDDDDKIDIYFTKPQQLLDIFAGMEEKSLLMIQKSQDNEEALEELQTVFAISKRKMGKEIGVLKKQTQMLEKLVSREEERAKDFTLMVKVDLKDVADTEHSSDSGSIGMGMPQMDLLSPTYAFSEDDDDKVQNRCIQS
uniref:Uncharacterized protein n=1 Tax=Strigamia maritima TaxID=126957 RepID=T1JCT9_STRMM